VIRTPSPGHLPFAVYNSRDVLHFVVHLGDEAILALLGVTQVFFSGLAPEFVGLYQINFYVPSDAASGNLQIKERFISLGNPGQGERDSGMIPNAVPG